MINITNAVIIFEEDLSSTNDFMIVGSTGEKGMISLTLHDKTILVYARDLRAAIDNAINNNR